ncbi:MAG: hypothetical protein D6797_08960 [Bdellovibrio sp.]|nr:MAG: hypothetical protein D6797_08960 [Bdellovibrio sp.]
MLASLTFKKWWDRIFPSKRLNSHRLFYNILFTFLLVWGFQWMKSYKGVWVWGPFSQWSWFFVLVKLAVFVGFLITLKYYDPFSFLGFKKEEKTSFVISPLHRYVRHPWYFLAFIYLWVRPLKDTDLVFSVIASLYLVIGTYLEEKKLILEIGEPYLQYKKQVPAFFPYRRRSLL